MPRKRDSATNKHEFTALSITHAVEESTVGSALRVEHLATLRMRCTLGCQVLDARDILAVDEARAEPGEHASATVAEAVEDAKAPLALAVSLEGLVERVAVTACTRGDGHLGSRGIARLGLLRRRAIGLGVFLDGREGTLGLKNQVEAKRAAA